MRMAASWFSIQNGSTAYKVVGAIRVTDGELASEFVVGFLAPARKASPDPASLPPVLVTVKDKSLRDGPAAHP